MAGTTWTVKELKSLRTILQGKPDASAKEVQKHFKWKPVEEIQALINRLQNSVDKQKNNLEAPIESWISMASSLVYREEVDHSENLARMMSLISEYEEFNSEGEFKPDYKLIYRYLAEVLKGSDTLPELPAIECAIVLDLMHSLVMVLRSKNTKVHEQIMQWKFKLLSTKSNIYQKNKHLEAFTKAFTNDFTDFTNPNRNVEPEEPWVPKPPKRRGRKRKTEEAEDKLNESKEETPFTKPKLFTLNPFCIPVSVLKLQDTKLLT